jgi:LacI family transcriptional regulator
VDALLLVGNYLDARLHDAIQSRGIPVVLVEAFCAIADYDSVQIDNVEGANIAIRYLIQKGHRHIAFLGSHPDSKISFHHRRLGYEQALKEHGIQNTYYGNCAHNDREEIIAATAQLMRSNPQITAIFGCNDEVSVIAMHGLMKLGKRIPEDISIVGFDNNANSENSFPPLTTMNVDKVGMGRLAVQLVVNRAENPDQGFITMRMHTRLIERSSVKDITTR